MITSVTYSSGKATQFNLYVGEEAPDVSSQVPLHSVLSVNITSSAGFVITAQGSNFTNSVFDATTLGAGQQVVVHGQLSTGTTPPTASARSIFLGLQPVLGNLSTSGPVVFTAADNKAGGFFMVPCSPLFQPQLITVVTSSNTTFVGLSNNLLSLTSTTPFLVTKGLVFYKQTGGTLNGVVWSAPANVQVTEQVHQLP